MDKNTRQSYKKYRMRGRTPFARITDRVLIFAVMYLALRPLYSSLGFASYIAVILAVCSLIIIGIILKVCSDISLDRFIKKERQRRKEAICIKQLVLMNPDDFSRIARDLSKKLYGDCFTVPLQKLNDLSCDTLLLLYKAAKNAGADKLVVVSLGAVAKDADEFFTYIKAEHIEVITIGRSELAKHLLLSETVSADDADNMLFDELDNMKQERRTLLEKIKVQKNAVPYLTLALALLIASFFAKYAWYYRFLSGVCIWCASFVFIKQRLKK